MPGPSHRDPTEAEWDRIGTSCDWGFCNEESVALRWSFELNDWLPVCKEHSCDLCVDGFVEDLDNDGGSVRCPDCYEDDR